MSVPEVIAHRGLTSRYAENTLDAFAAAVATGADGIELDVRASADNVLVVHHDSVLSPQSGFGPSSTIRSLRFAELRNEIVGGENVPTLDEVLRLIAGTVKVYVEVKAPDIEAVVCQALSGRESWCALHSFDHRIIAKAHDLAPIVPRGVLLSSYLVDPLGPLRDTSARDLWQQWELIDSELIGRVHAYGSRVIAWTVDDMDAARSLIAWGVDAICTDRCDEMLSLVGRSRPLHISSRQVAP